MGFIRKKTTVQVELNKDSKENERIKQALTDIGNNLTVEEMELLSKAVKDNGIKQTAINYLKLM